MTEEDLYGMKDVAAAIGDLIHNGTIPADVGHQAIGAVAAWRAGFHDVALDEMTPDLVVAVEDAITRAGLEVPWPRSHESGPDPAP